MADLNAEINRIRRHSLPNRDLHHNILDNNNNQEVQLPFFISDDPNIDPRKQSIFIFFKELYCPHMKLLSVSTIIVLLDIALYSICLVFGINTEDLNCLLPPLLKIVNLIGGFNPSEMKEKKILNIYKWFTNSFIHANLGHLFYIVIGLLMIGNYVEKLIGKKLYFLLYLVSGVLGLLLSGLITTNQTSLGGSISLFGIIGGFLSFCFIRWKRLNDALGLFGKCYIYYFVFFFLFLSLIFQYNSNYVTFVGNLGGFIIGFLFLFCIYKPNNELESLWMNDKNWRYLSYSLISLFTVGGFLLFYLY